MLKGPEQRRCRRARLRRCFSPFSIVSAGLQPPQRVLEIPEAVLNWSSACLQANAEIMQDSGYMYRDFRWELKCFSHAS